VVTHNGFLSYIDLDLGQAQVIMDIHTGNYASSQYHDRVGTENYHTVCQVPCMGSKRLMCNVTCEKDICPLQRRTLAH